ncbi:MAG: N-formylglutamate amidohydrolase [Parvularcula sp.]|jgi:N-formylglutamate amidohydrolase|nr:N-formylglutamate amidohydrolase [Parvularcula sp.]
MVARIVKETYPGHEVSRPALWQHPMIFSCPHAGRDYPRKLLGQSPLSLELLRRSEDAYVDQLIPAAASRAVPVVSANFPRLFVDVNRSPRELDPQLFAGALDDASESKSNRVIAGFGVIPKLAANGRPIYTSRLPSSEARARLKHCFTPYHDALSGLLTEAKRRFSQVLLVDWHSMPSAQRGTHRLPDIVLGDLYGASCHGEDTALWEDAFSAEGFEVARNTPYAGGYVASHYGRPREGVGVLQIEINRALYLDEQRVARSARFKTFAQRIDNVVMRVFDAYAPAAQVAE